MLETGRETGAESSGGVAEQIAVAAVRLFATRGYDATSVREIAAAAGVTKPTLYYHFGSKEGLATALITGPMKRAIARARAMLAGPADPVSVLVGVTEDKFADCRSDPDRWRFVLALAFGPHGSTLAADLGELAAEMDGLLLEAVRRLADRGIIGADRVEAFSVCLRGLSVIHTLDFLYRGAGLEPGLADRLVSDLLRGFGRDRSVTT